jgi:flagellar hook-associated protein 2
MSSLSSIGSGSTLASLTNPPITISGLASGLNTSSIIQGLLAVNQQQISNLQGQESSINQQQSAFQSIETQLQALQGDIVSLGSSQNNVFDQQSVNSSNASVVTGTANGSAAPGVYSLQVNNTATAEQVASQGFTSANSPIAQGTFQIGIGSGPSTTITIDSNNDTLHGLATAINNSGIGLSATVLDNGSASQPYQLLLTSTQTGAANTININYALAQGADPTQQPLFDTVVQQATNASVTLGSGTGSLRVTSATNQIANLINGVTVNLQGTPSGQTVQLTVTNNAQSAVQAVQNFVTDYNNLIQNISAETAYNTSTNTAAPLLGNNAVDSLLQQLQSIAGAVVPGVNPLMNNLTQLGITTNSSGQLVINQAQLNNVLNGQVAGVSSQDVKNLFAMNGTSTNPVIQFVTGSTSTVPSTTPITVNITQAGGNGSNVAGSFVVNGVTEPAQGNGQILIGDSSNAHTAGLEVAVNLTPSQVGSGASGQLTLTSGIASQMAVVLNNMLDPVNGELQTINQGFQTSISSINTQITQAQNAMNARQQQLVAQFSAMEESLAQLKTISSLLTSQFNANSNLTQGTYSNNNGASGALGSSNGLFGNAQTA